MRRHRPSVKPVSWPGPLVLAWIVATTAECAEAPGFEHVARPVVVAFGETIVRPLRQASSPIRESVFFAPGGNALAAATREGVSRWGFPLPSLEHTTGAISSDPQSRNCEETGARKPSRHGRAPRIATALFNLVNALVATIHIILLPLLVFSHLATSLDVFEAKKKQCLLFLRCWVKRDGMTLVDCRILWLPTIWRLRVEDRGIERRGWAIISGRYTGTAPNAGFIPLGVRYLHLRRAARSVKSLELGKRTALWDDWLDGHTGA